MAEWSGFFNSEAGDVREYGAEVFAEYFANFIKDGVYVKNNILSLPVTAGSGLNVNIGVGSAWIKGYTYKNDSLLNKSISPPDAVLNRIDRVVLRFDEVNRKITSEIKTGTFASSPNPPSLTNTPTIKELSLAKVIVNKGATSVIIIDERLTEFCGQVSLLIDIPLNDLLNEWQDFKNTTQVDFNDFMQGLENILDENTAGNLLNLININIDNISTNTNAISQINDDIALLETTKMGADKIILSANNADINLMEEGQIWMKYK